MSFSIKTPRYTAAYLAIATPNTHPPTVDQKPIQPASTCALEKNRGWWDIMGEGRSQEKKRGEGYSVFNMQSMTMRTELDGEQALSV